MERKQDFVAGEIMNKCNKAMDRLLTRVYRHGVTPYVPQKIWEKRTLDGNPFWGIGNFCGISVDGVIQYGRKLTDLEWEGNELFFFHEDQECLEREVIAAYLALKQQMEEEFSDWIFDLVVSVDEENHTGTIRFYGIRDGYHYIIPTQENLEEFKDEAILVETVNEIYMEQYLPYLEERLKAFTVRMEFTGKDEIRIQDTRFGSYLDICWNEEFTMYFGSFHSHYGEDEWEMLFDDIVKILDGSLVSARIESSGRWLGSYLLEPGNIPLTSKSKLLSYLFGRQKDFYKEVQKNGGIFSVTAWDEKKSRTYRITEKGMELTEEEWG